MAGLERIEDINRLRPSRRIWRLHRRLFVAIALGVAVLLVALASPWRMSTRLLAAWDIGLVFYLALTYRSMAHAPVSRIRWRAKSLFLVGHRDDVAGLGRANFQPLDPAACDHPRCNLVLLQSHGPRADREYGVQPGAGGALMSGS